MRAWQALHISLIFSRFLVANTRLAHRSPTCSFFYNCILQGAIDFAEVRKRSWRLERNAARSSAYLRPRDERSSINVSHHFHYLEKDLKTSNWDDISYDILDLLEEHYFGGYKFRLETVFRVIHRAFINGHWKVILGNPLYVVKL